MRKPQVRVVELFFLLLVAAFAWAFARIMAPFFLNAFLALVFSGLGYGVFRRVENVVRNRPAAAAITVLGAFVVVAIPVGLIGLMIYSEAVGGYARVVEAWPDVSEQLLDFDVGDWLRNLPAIGGLITEAPEVEFAELVRSVFEVSSDFIVEISRRSFVNITSALLNVVVILFLMFFFFLDGPRLVKRIYEWVPLPDAYLQQLGEEALRTTSATLISTVIIGMIEGLYGALIFVVFGLPSPVLWGGVILILSMIPLIGANMVLTPAGIIVLLSGDVVSGLAIVALGYGGVLITQNIIRPKLLGDRSGLHPALVLLGTIGGIAWLGLIGFLVGPLLVSLFLAVWSQFAGYYRDQYLDKRDNGIDPGNRDGDDPRGRDGSRRSRRARIAAATTRSGLEPSQMMRRRRTSGRKPSSTAG